jgi:hypothetical protein
LYNSLGRWSFRPGSGRGRTRRWPGRPRPARPEGSAGTATVGAGRPPGGRAGPSRGGRLAGPAHRTPRTGAPERHRLGGAGGS